jgi:adenosine deaminase
MMVRDFGFGLDDLRTFMLDGIAGSWLPEAQRRRWQAQWATEFDVLRARFRPDTSSTSD